VAAALIAGAFGTAGTAQAASQQDDFNQGTHETGKTALLDGGVELAKFADTFNQVPAAWMTSWPGAPAATTADGTLHLNQALMNSNFAAPVGSSLTFRAALGGQRSQHVGLAAGFTNERWAIFSRPDDPTSNAIFARTQNGALKAETLLTITPGAHTYRIDRTTEGMKYYVDNVLVAEHNDPFGTAEVFPQASDLYEGVPLDIEFMSFRDASSGTFTSQVLNAGDSRVTGIQFRPEATDGVTFKVRSGNTPPVGNDGWSDWTPTSVIAPGRYFQYRATLTANNAGASPRLSRATVDFAIETPPSGTNNTPPGGTPAGDTKKPKLRMPRDADVDRRGKVKILLTCPDDELFCRAALAFKSGRKTIASKSGKIAGGDSRYITLKLSKSAKKALAKARKMKVTAVLVVRDAAGNKRTSSKKIWLYPL
jgi:hypothetical protein